MRVVRPVGNERVFDLRTEVCRDGDGNIAGFNGTAQDITARKRIEQGLAEQEQRFRALVEQNVAGIVIIRDTGTIAYVNPYMAALLGHAAPEIIGQTLTEFVPADEQATVAEKLRAQLSGEEPFVQFASSIQAHDGRLLSVLVNASRLAYEGRWASIAVVIDTTDRDRIERELAFSASVLATRRS